MKAGLKCAHCGASRTDLVVGRFDGLCPGCLAVFAKGEAGPATRLGKFALSAQLGMGASGEVWKAWDTVLRRWVALKVFHAINPEDLARITREAETTAKLSHPNIAAIYEVGEENGRHFLAMQYVEGLTMARFPRRDRKLLVRLIRDAARAVGAAHTKGIVHRDLKPANLVVTKLPKERAGFHVYVLDFGLARPVEGSRVTATGIVVGTPAYMSPEQARGEEVDGRGDVYSLGASLYELMSGKPPFRGPNVYEVLRKVQEKEAKRPRALDSSIPKDLETVILKCLEKEPARRYSTAGEFADDLGRWLDGDPVLARRISWTYRLSRALGKRKPFVAAVAAGLLIAGGLTAYTVGSRVAESRARDRSQPHLEAGRRLIDQMKARKRESNHKPEEVREIAGRAQKEFDLALAEFAHLPEAHMGAATAWRVAGDTDRALAALERVLQQAPEHPAAYLDRVRLSLREYASQAFPLRSDSPAETPSTQALKASLKSDLDRANRQADPTTQLHARALTAFVDGAFEEAERLLAQLMAVVPGESDTHVWRIRALYRLKRWKEAEEACDRAIDWDARNEMAYLFRGLLRQNRGLWEKAVLDYSSALDANTVSKEALLLRGNARRQSRDLDGALQDLERALSTPPATALLHEWIGDIRAAKGDYPAAMAAYAAALAIDSGHRCAHCGRGRVLRTQKKPHEAIREFDKALGLDPKHVEALTNRGLACQDLGDLSGAIANLSQALEVEPSLDTFLLRSAAHKRNGDSKRAEEDIEAALKIEPKDRCGFCRRGNLFVQRKRLDEAIQDYDRALDIDPHHSEAYNNRGGTYRRKGKHAEAEADFEKAVECDPRNAQARLNRGVARSARKDSTGALEDFAAALDADPKNVMALYQRALEHSRAGKTSEAFADINQAIEIDGRYRRAYLARGDFHRNAAQPKLALADYEKALELQKDAEVLVLMGRTHVDMGEFDPAHGKFNEALGLDPNNVSALFNRGIAYKEMRRFGEAIQDYTRVLQLEPKHAKAYTNRGQCHHELGNSKAAMDDFRKSIELDDLNPLPYFNIGVILQSRGDLDGAIAEYTKAVDLGLKSAYLHFNRGVARGAKGKLEEAMADYAQALDLEYRMVCAHCNRANIWQIWGKADEAENEANLALKLDPNHAEAYFYLGNVYWRFREDLVRARDAFAIAVAKKTDFDSAFINLSIVRRELGDFPGAIEAATAAIKINSEAADSYFYRGLAKWHAKDLKGALADYSLAIARDGNYADAFNNRANTHRGLGDVDSALKDYTEAIRCDSKIALFWANRGDVHFIQGRLEEAIGDFGEALERDPRMFRAWKARGWARYDLGLFAEALEDLREASRLGMRGPPADYARFGIWLLQARVEGKEAAGNDLKEYAKDRAAGKGSDWPGQVLKFLMGNLAEAALLKLAASEDAAEKVADHSCEAYFYAGIKRLISGDQSKAREYLQKAVDTKTAAAREYGSAIAELKRLAK